MIAHRIACFGEMMLRVSPDTDGRWLDNSKVDVYIGGAELNAASALAAWGQPVKFVTALPDNTVAGQLQRSVRSRGVDLHAEILPGSRLGVYYLTQGAELKGAGVTYDRDRSAFSLLRPGMVDWQQVLGDCSWFHISAINPALNEHIPAVCLEALQAARKMGLKISIDLNYRPKLWQYGKKPVEVMPDLVQFADLIMGNIWSVQELLGIPAGIGSSVDKTDAELIAAAEQNARALNETYDRASEIIYTFRLPDRYFGVAFDGSAVQVSRRISMGNIVDRAGSGDCFMGGLIYGSVNGWSIQQKIDLAATAAVNKMGEWGDHTRHSLNSLLSQIPTVS